VDVATALAIGAVVFAAGGGWITLARTDKRGAIQGKRIGRLENRISTIEGMLKVARRPTAPLGVPTVEESEDE